MNPLTALRSVTAPMMQSVSRAGGTSGIKPGEATGLGKIGGGGVGGLDFDGMLRNAAASATEMKPAFPDASSLGPVNGNRLNVLVGSNGASMEGALRGFVGEVNAKQLDASGSINSLLSGEKVPLHQTMIKVEEASVAFSLMVEVRNKLMESYQELMRMQI